MFSYKDRDHQIVGPLPAEEIRQLIGGGVIERHSLLRREGTDFWQPAAKFEEFLGLFEGMAELEALNRPNLEPAPPTPVIDVNASVMPATSVALETAAAEPGSADRRSEATGEPAPPPVDAEPPRGTAVHFFMIGGDGREYGPVTGTQLREWIAQRRANAATRIRRADQKDFSPLGSWPEFAEPKGASENPPPPAPPALDSAQAEQLAAEIIGRGYNLSIGQCFARSWKLYTRNFWLLTGATAIVLILHSVLHAVPVLGNVAAVALAGVLSAGLSALFLKLIRGQRAEFSDLFTGFQRSFVPLILASTVTFILVSAGLLMCVLPGVYLAVAWLFAYPLIIERSLDFWPAMELSRKVVHERWWGFFPLGILALLSVIGGILLTILLLGLGIVFSVPIAITFGALMYAYEDIFGERRVREE